MKTNVIKGCLVRALNLRAPTSASAQSYIATNPHTLTLGMYRTNGLRKVLVRATDDLGQKVVALEARDFSDSRLSADSTLTFSLQPLTNSTSLNLEILVQQSIPFDYFVAPPQVVSGIVR
jgi:hypothetical protein